MEHLQTCTLFCRAGATFGRCVLYKGRAIRIYIAGRGYSDFSQLRRAIGLTKVTVDGKRVL